jgi:hypothetical protein
VGETDFRVRSRVAELGREEVPVSHIVSETGKSRPTVIRWLESEGIEPVMLRGEKAPKEKVSLRNTPLALSIERGVRQRLTDEGEE